MPEGISSYQVHITIPAKAYAQGKWGYPFRERAPFQGNILFNFRLARVFLVFPWSSPRETQQWRALHCLVHDSHLISKKNQYSGFITQGLPTLHSQSPGPGLC
ncbi:hypothetical protein CapIbe_019745 [Capra ibex]